MSQPVLNIEELTVESFTTSDSYASQDAPIGDMDTGCVSDCATGCGFGGYNC